MGAWGEGPTDNDTAADLADDPFIYNDKMFAHVKVALGHMAVFKSTYKK